MFRAWLGASISLIYHEHCRLNIRDSICRKPLASTLGQGGGLVRKVAVLWNYDGKRWLYSSCNGANCMVLNVLVASQTLGEEYTDIWQISSVDKGFPSISVSILFVVLLVGPLNPPRGGPHWCSYLPCPRIYSHVLEHD